jgi:HlyD family secretion protein
LCILSLYEQEQTLRKVLIATIVVAVPLAIGGAYYFGIVPGVGHGDWRKNIVKVEKGSVDVKIEATGTIKPFNEVKVSPKLTGLIKQLMVKQGDVVKEGQVIAQMDVSNLTGQIESARGTYLMAQDAHLKLLHGNRPQEIAISRLQERRARDVVRQAEHNVIRLSSQVESAGQQALRDETLATRQAFLAREGAASDQDRLNAETQAAMTRAQLEAAKRELAGAEAAVNQAKADLAASQQQMDMSQVGSRAEDIAQAAHAVAQAKGNLNYLQSQLNDMTIRAPFAGVITQKYADAGAIVTPTTSSATTSATSSSIVALAGKLEMVAQVAETDIGKIQAGQEVEILSAAYPEKPFHGHVTQIAPAAVVTSNVTTFEVHSSIDDDKDGKLLSGMNVSARFKAGKVDDALLVPTVCIVSRHGKTGVMVPEADGSPTFKPVKVGSATEQKTVILRGVAEGDQIFMGLTKEGLEQGPQADGAGPARHGGRKLDGTPNGVAGGQHGHR